MPVPAAPPGPVLDLRLVPAALTAWLVTALGIRWAVGPVLVGGCLAVGTAAVVLRRTRTTADTAARALGTAVAAAAVVGAGFGMAITLRGDAVAHHPVTGRFGTVGDVTVVVTESPRALGSGRVLLRANLRRLGVEDAGGLVVVFAPAADFGRIGAGTPVRFRARIAPPTRHDLTVAVLTAAGAPDAGRAHLIHRIAAGIRERFAVDATAVLPAGRAALLPALVLGDTSALDAGTQREFRAAGLTHLTAVSGANVTIVCGAVLLSAYLVGPRGAVVLSGLALAAFVVVVQPTASVLRAAVMGALALLAVLTARRRQSVPALAGTVLAVLVVAPQMAVDVGFALSVAATAALVLIAPRWSGLLKARGWPGPLADGVAIAAAAQFVTAPLVAGVSGAVSVVGVLANLAVAAVIPPITLLGTAAAALGTFWPDGARLVMRFTGPPLWWLQHVAHWLGSAPAATVPVPSGLTGVTVVALSSLAALLLWRRRWFRRSAAAVAVCLLAWTLSGPPAGYSASVSAGRDTIVG